MKIYRVFSQITAGAWAEITATSLEDAQDKAADLEISDYKLGKNATEILPLEIEYEGEHDANE